MYFKTSGVCSNSIDFDIKDGVITHLSFDGGCNGNLQGIGSLLVDMKVEDAIKKLKGITCGTKSTSCPDQVSIALIKYLEENK